MEAHCASQDRYDSGSWVGSASSVAGSSLPGPKLPLRDLARLFLSVSGSREQWDAVAGSAFSAAAVSGAWIRCSGAGSSPLCVSTPGVGSPSGGASVTGSSGQWERLRESPRFEWRHRRSSSGERSQSGKRHRGGRSPSPARSSHLARSSASSSSASSGASVQEGVMPPSPQVVVALGVSVWLLAVTALLVLVFGSGLGVAVFACC